MSTSTATLACIGEPISWLRLETFALGAPDPAVDTHVAECAACRHCLEQLRADTLALPVLAIPTAVKKAQRAWWKTAAPILAAAAAAVVIFVVAKRPDDAVVREERVSVKGIGEVVLGTVRERGGAITEDAHTFVAGDRWKLVLTCAPAGEVHTDVSIIEVGGNPSPDHPLQAATIACGNRVVLPGAFTLTGSHANRVCVAFDTATRACVTIKPE